MQSVQFVKTADPTVKTSAGIGQLIGFSGENVTLNKIYGAEKFTKTDYNDVNVSADLINVYAE